MAGGVGVGKSSAAEAIARSLALESVSVEVLGGDCFLHTNEELSASGLTMRKGFPESFDNEALEACLRRLKARGSPPDQEAGGGCGRLGPGAIEVPVYSHVLYDRVPGQLRTLDPTDVVIVEGVNALQPPVLHHLDLSVYVDAKEADMRRWFVERFVELCEAAKGDRRSFYAMFASLPADELRSIGDSAWTEINAVNLHDHILPTRERASFVVQKDRDHSVRIVRSDRTVL